MNVLIGQNHLDRIGGTEKWTYDIIKGLVNNPDVKNIGLFTFELGVMSEKIKNDFGIEANKFSKKIVWDKAIINHWTCVEKASWWIRSKEVSINALFQVVHGTLPSLEKPFTHDKSVKFVAISEEIQSYLSVKYGLKSVVIKNMVDEEKFTMSIPKHISIRNIYSLAQSDDFNIRLKKLFESKGYNFNYNNKHSDPKVDISENVKNADVVISLGRGVYESMMCGKFVIVADERNYQGGLMDGAVLDENRDFFAKYNFSGRAKKLPVSDENLIAELNKFSITQCQSNREYAKNNFTIREQTKKFLKL